MHGMCGGNLQVAMPQHAYHGQRITFLSPLCGFWRSHSDGQVSHLQCSKSCKVFSGNVRRSLRMKELSPMCATKGSG